MTLEKIKKHLTSKIKINFIKVYDYSQFHNYSKKGLTHLKIIIVSNNFIDEKLINRHRMIFTILSQIQKETIYSITLNTYTLNEWKYKKYTQNDASRCLKRK